VSQLIKEIILIDLKVLGGYTKGLKKVYRGFLIEAKIISPGFYPGLIEGH
jgi:hypothetical protein